MVSTATNDFDARSGAFALARFFASRDERIAWLATASIRVYRVVPHPDAAKRRPSAA